jgi:glyoxylase-like metal-dependent hydrolase (beta-lactamase superfamily II)
MQRERVADDIYVFTSDLYAQVTASAIITSAGAVVVDTLVYPEETRQIKRFVESRLGTPVAYVINTHYHADHTTGTCFFDGARVVSHALCRSLLDKRGRESLEKSKASSEDLREVELVLPDLVFESGTLTLHVGDKTLQLRHSPGHSPDSIVCSVPEDRVLLAADTMMPLPYFVDGSYDDFVTSLKSLQTGYYENIVQGHGEVILRGEIDEKIQGDLDYLRLLREAVDHALEAGTSVEDIEIETCGKSRILLNGTAQQLHRQNALALAQQRRELVQQL